MRRVARKMRQAFFAEFGSIDRMTEEEVNLCLSSMVSFHMGELVEFYARFGNADHGLRAQIQRGLDVFIKSNEDQILEIAGKGDAAAKRQFLITG